MGAGWHKWPRRQLPSGLPPPSLSFPALRLTAAGRLPVLGFLSFSLLDSATVVNRNKQTNKNQQPQVRTPSLKPVRKHRVLFKLTEVKPR